MSVSGRAPETEIRAVIAELDERECPRESYALLAARVRRLEASGKTIPSELLREQSRLLAECQAQSQGR